MGVGNGADTDGIQRQIPSEGGNLVGGGPDTEGGRRLLRHRFRGGGVEGSSGDYQLLLHRLHHLPRLPSWVTGGSRYGDRHPRGQNASSVNGHEGGGT